MEMPMDPAVITDAEAAAKIEWRSLEQPGCWVKPLGRSPVTGAVGDEMKVAGPIASEGRRANAKVPVSPRS